MIPSSRPVVRALCPPPAPARRRPRPVSAGSCRPTPRRWSSMGFRAGARLDELQALVRRHSMAGSLRCDRAKADPRVSECRGDVHRSPNSAGRSTCGSPPSTAWRASSPSRATVGAGPARPLAPTHRAALRPGRTRQVQGSQWMMQWVRQGRMLRLTWRHRARREDGLGEPGGWPGARRWGRGATGDQVRPPAGPGSSPRTLPARSRAPPSLVLQRAAAGPAPGSGPARRRRPGLAR